MGVNWADNLFWLDVRRNIPNREDAYYTTEKALPREAIAISFLQSFKNELGNAQDTLGNNPALAEIFNTAYYIWSLISVGLWIWRE